MMEEIVHIIPLGLEFDRAIIPFEGKQGFKPNRVYLLTIKSPRDAPQALINEHMVNAQRVKEYFIRKKIEVIEVDTKLIDILDVMGKISYLVNSEKKQGNNVYVNMSSAGRLTALAAALSGMFYDVKVYYVKATSYSKTNQERAEHGITICTNREIVFLENFKIHMPTQIEKIVLVELYKKGKMKTIDIIIFLEKINDSGFAKDYFKMSRSEKTSTIMKLNRNVLDKLESSGYICKEKFGRENQYELTESGKYVANISGLIEIKSTQKYENK